MDRYFGPGGLSEAMEDVEHTCHQCGKIKSDDGHTLCESCRLHIGENIDS